MPGASCRRQRGPSLRFVGSVYDGPNLLAKDVYGDYLDSHWQSSGCLLVVSVNVLREQIGSIVDAADESHAWASLPPTGCARHPREIAGDSRKRRWKRSARRTRSAAALRSPPRFYGGTCCLLTSRFFGVQSRCLLSAPRRLS